MSTEISVILPIYNASLYLKDAIDSILNQSFRDFELIVYDDGSTDGSRTIVDSYQDDRIIKRYFDDNQGLIKILNLGFSEAKGKYIARMDADDISHPNRFEIQRNFLESNPEIGICGTQLELIHTGELLERPTEDGDIRWWIFKGSPFAHPSVMIRKQVIDDHNLRFDPKAYVVEDFDFWWHLAFHTKLANLNQTLLKYRVHEQQESTAKHAIQIKNFKLSQIDFIQHLGIDSEEFTPDIINDILSRNLNITPENLIKISSFFKALSESKIAVKFFGEKVIESQRDQQIQFALKSIDYYSPKLIQLIFTNGFKSNLNKTGMRISAYLLKSLIKWKTKKDD